MLLVKAGGKTGGSLTFVTVTATPATTAEERPSVTLTANVYHAMASKSTSADATTLGTDDDSSANGSTGVGTAEDRVNDNGSPSSSTATSADVNDKGVPVGTFSGTVAVRHGPAAEDTLQSSHTGGSLTF